VTAGLGRAKNLKTHTPLDDGVQESVCWCEQPAPEPTVEGGGEATPATMGRVINRGLSSNSRAKVARLRPEQFLPELNFSPLSGLESLPTGKALPPCLLAHTGIVAWL
jgi:hypothetical protein